MALRGGADDREAEARAWLAVLAAPEAGERLLGILGPRPFVRNAQPRDAVDGFGRKRDPASRRPIELGVPHEVRERTLKGRMVAVDGDGRGRLDVGVRVRLGR